MTESLSPLPYEPETIEDARARLWGAVSRVLPESRPPDERPLTEVRRHSFDAWRPYRLVVSTPGGREMGPKLHCSLWHCAPHGRFRVLEEPVYAATLRLVRMVRELTGNTDAAPFMAMPHVLTAPGGDPAVYGIQAFFRYDTLPSQN